MEQRDQFGKQKRSRADVLGDHKVSSEGQPSQDPWRTRLTPITQMDKRSPRRKARISCGSPQALSKETDAQPLSSVCVHKVHRWLQLMVAIAESQWWKCCVCSFTIVCLLQLSFNTKHFLFKIFLWRPQSCHTDKKKLAERPNEQFFPYSELRERSRISQKHFPNSRIRGHARFKQNFVEAKISTMPADLDMSKIVTRYHFKQQMGLR